MDSEQFQALKAKLIEVIANNDPAEMAAMADAQLQRGWDSVDKQTAIPALAAAYAMASIMGGLREMRDIFTKGLAYIPADFDGIVFLQTSRHLTRNEVTHVISSLEPAIKRRVPNCTVIVLPHGVEVGRVIGDVPATGIDMASGPSKSLPTYLS